MKPFCFLILLIGAVAASDTDGLITGALKFVKDCNDKSITLCVKERAIQLFEKTKGDFELSEGIKLVQTDDEPQPEQGRSLNDVELSDDPDTREQEVDSLLVDRVARFLGSHTLQFKVSKESIKDVQRSLEEARGKTKKGKKYLMPLLMLMKLKAAALLPLAIGVLALISLKALVIGKLALIISAIIGLKKLLEGKHSSSYEVVAHPHHSFSYDEHGSAHGGAFRRSIDAQKLAYNAQQ